MLIANTAILLFDESTEIQIKTRCYFWYFKHIVVYCDKEMNGLLQDMFAKRVFPFMQCILSDNFLYIFIFFRVS